MSLDLPDVLAAFFAAENRGDTEGLGACFADHAVVRDEGRIFEGVSAIKQWMREAKAKYQHTVEPIDVVRRDGRTVVTATVAGRFPISPVKLDHIFGVEGDRIASLEIR
jgi:hypothetical protein